MVDPSIHSAIAAAVPVVVGGFLAVGGGVVGQFAAYRLGLKRDIAANRLTLDRDRRNMRRERMESLVRALYENQEWLYDRYSAFVVSNEPYNKPSPLYEAQMIQRLHFPEMDEDILDVLTAQQGVLEYMTKEKKNQLAQGSSWSLDATRDDYYKMYGAMQIAVIAMTKKCQTLLES